MTKSGRQRDKEEIFYHSVKGGFSQSKKRLYKIPQSANPINPNSDNGQRVSRKDAKKNHAKKKRKNAKNPINPPNPINPGSDKFLNHPHITPKMAGIAHGAF